MKSFIYTLLFIGLFFTIQKVKAQDEGGTQKQYIPNITVASPQAASLSKVGEIPIDLSTGRMNYTIPIFEIKEGSFTMPINLSYNYSGLLLDETPGYAGVGWTFNIGGSILHNINGLDDYGHESDKESIYNYINKLPPFDDYLSPEGLTRINHFAEFVANGIFDGEPDKYSVNAGNLNCSFYLDKDNNAIFLKNENYKVSGYSHSGFTVTDDKGIRYIFNKALNNSRSSANNSSDYISSFLLTEINFPYSTNKILFEYDAVDSSYNDKSITQTLTQNSSKVGIVQSFEINKNISYTNIGTNKLKKITTNSYTIELQYSSNPTESAIAVISNLSVKDKFQKPVKSYEFTYSGWVGRRTNLLNVKYNGSVTNEMEYDMSSPYPLLEEERDYARKDLWGYYNKVGTPATVSGLITPNNNPTLKPSFSDTKIGALTKITYQTKGYSLIDYEPNIINTTASTYNFPYESDGIIAGGANATTMAINEQNIAQDTFTITNVPAKVKINYSFTNHSQIAPTDYRIGNEISISKDGAVIFSKKQDWLWELRWIPTDLIISKQEEITITTPGTYSVKAFSVLGASSAIMVSVVESLPSFNQRVGGIRVKQTKNCDFNGECITTNYNYSASDETSTGVMLQRPEFYSGYHIQDNSLCIPSIYVRQDFYNYTSIYPLSNFRGSPVLYKKVEKADFGRDENDQVINNGKTFFSYYGEPVSNSILDLESYFVIGLLGTKEVKDKSDTSVLKEDNNYVISIIPNTTKFLYFLSSKMVREKRAQFSGGPASGSGCALQYPRPLLDFQVASFKYQSKNYILQKQENTNYFHGNSLKQTTIYDYNADTGFLKSKVTNNSENETIETKFYYPKDPEMVSEPFRNELIAKNMIGMPLVVQNYNGVKLSEQKTEYTQDTSTSNFLLPKYVYISKGTAPIDNSIDKKITYDKYDDKGNVLQYSIESGTPVSIIWGYSKTQPIAKVENATYDQISNYVANLQSLSDSDSDNCMSASCTEELLRIELKRFQDAFPNAFISTYTYNPLVGVTSLTDPKGITSYYEYDSFGRLKFVKDKNLNVLQKYCYNYKGQQVDCSDNSSTSVILYKSAARSGSFTRNNCDLGGAASSVIYNQGVGAFTSSISQAEADALGGDKFNTDGQAYANANATCTFSSVAKSGWFVRNNCAAGGTPGGVTYTVPAGRYSDVSQAGADAQAQNDVNNNGQAYANANTTCTFYNIAKSGWFTRNNCAAVGTPGGVTYTVPAGRYSDNSQEGADAQAQTEVNNNGQAYANANATCTFYNIAKSGWFTRNNCAAGGTPDSVTYTVPAGRYGDNSQEGADAQAQTDMNNNGQNYANASALCTFYSVAKSGWFVRNNCAAGGTPSGITYTVSAGSYSDNSQEGADAQAQNDVNNNGQTYANANATCTFYNIAKSGWFVRNNCAAGGTPGGVTYTVAAGLYSDVSQAGADAQAQNDVNNNGQAYANANAICTFYNIAKNGWFTRNNCAAGGTPGGVAYTIPAGSYSDDSQEGADAQAQNDVNNNGQTYANANATCTFWNTTKSVVFERNNCAAGGTPGTVVYTVPAGRYSDVSQAGADAQAQTEVNNNGQAYANATATCTFWNTAKTVIFVRNNCSPGGRPSNMPYTVAAHTYSSTVSQLAADNLAQADIDSNGQSYANTNAYCEFKNVAKSQVFTKNNCAPGGVPSSYEYIVAADVFTSHESQEAANNLAQSALDTYGQNYVNTYGTCTFYNVAKSSWFTRNNCTTGGVPNGLNYAVPAGRYSDVSQEGADAQAQRDIDNNGQNYVNTTAQCTFYSIARSGIFTKNNCPSGGLGSNVSYSQPAGTSTSIVSQADVDLAGLVNFDRDGQNYANTNGTCTTVTYNAVINDYEPELRKAWIVLTASNANHATTNITVKIRYDYPKINSWVSKTVVIPFEAGQTSKIYELQLNFISKVEVQSFTVN